jgi:hypothetical protein
LHLLSPLLHIHASRVQINTLFPSPKTEEGIKGGVVLLRMRPPVAGANSTPLQLSVTYTDREGKQFRCGRTFKEEGGHGGVAHVPAAHLVCAPPLIIVQLACPHPSDAAPNAQWLCRSRLLPVTTAPVVAATLAPTGLRRQCCWPDTQTSCTTGESIGGESSQARVGNAWCLLHQQLCQLLPTRVHDVPFPTLNLLPPTCCSPGC